MTTISVLRRRLHQSSWGCRQCRREGRRLTWPLAWRRPIRDATICGFGIDYQEPGHRDAPACVSDNYYYKDAGRQRHGGGSQYLFIEDGGAVHNSTSNFVRRRNRLFWRSKSDSTPYAVRLTHVQKRNWERESFDLDLTSRCEHFKLLHCAYIYFCNNWNVLVVFWIV
jgi:hypothetical protein